MSLTGQVTLGGSVAGISLNATISETGGGQEGHVVALPAGNQSTAWTKTDANTGAATLAAGHTIVDGATVDVYWSAGKRLGLTATVATNTVTLDGGAGDDLPASDTVVIVSNQVAVADASWIGADLKLLVVTCDQRAAIDLQSSVPASLLVIEIGAANGAYFWAKSSGITNPLATATVASATASNGSTTAATLQFGVLLTS